MTRTWHHARVLLPWSCLALAPVGRLAEIPVVAMAIAGAVLLARRRLAWLRDPAPALLVTVFACMWIPILVSVPDAVRPDQAARIAANHLRFLLAGLFMIAALGDREALGRFSRLTAWLLALWVLDAVVQGIAGRDLLGQLPTGGRLTGPYGPRSGKFGLILAVLSPLLVEYARTVWGARASVAVGVVVFAVVFAAGTRSGWVAATVVAGCYWALTWRARGRFPWRITVAALVLGGAVVATSAALSPRVQTRIAEFGVLFEGGEQWNALGQRIWIWRGTWNTFLAHPVNGVGARGLRHAFVDHAAPGDPFVAADPPLVPAHPHHVLLEIASETGLVGLAGFLLAVLAMARGAAVTPRPDRDPLLGAGFALVAALWPLNTHLALYSALWSQVIWWLVALYCAALAVARTRRDDASAPGNL